jgi:hypothetical protein
METGTTLGEQGSLPAPKQNAQPSVDWYIQPGPILQDAPQLPPFQRSTNSTIDPIELIAKASEKHHQPNAARGPLAVADWTPSNVNSEEPIEDRPGPSDEEGREGVITAAKGRKTSSTEDTTESDSEKDAAEVYFSRKNRLVSGDNTCKSCRATIVPNVLHWLN